MDEVRLPAGVAVGINEAISSALERLDADTPLGPFNCFLSRDVRPGEDASVSVVVTSARLALREDDVELIEQKMRVALRDHGLPVVVIPGLPF